MKLLLVLLVITTWMGLTTLAAWATPNRNRDEPPDLIYDDHWLLRSPPNPVEKDHLPARPTTTPPPPPAPRRVVPPRPPPAPEVAPSPPAPRSYPPGVEQWRPLVAQYGDWDVDLMLAIMRCESGGRANAINSIGAAGLFQHYPTPANWSDPASNVALAHSKWTTRGTQPWDSSKGCWG